MKNPQTKKIEIKATREQLVEYTQMCQLGLTTKSFNDYIAAIYGKHEGTVVADLQGEDLRRVNLDGANLQKTNMQGANLQGAYLQGANLAFANLQGANLREAYLQEADMREVDLRGTDLKWANLNNAILPIKARSDNNCLRNLPMLSEKQAKKTEIKATREQLVEYAQMCRLGLATKSFNDYIASIHGKGEGTVIADLQGVDLKRPDLHDADLRGIDLRGTDLLYGADLHGADLRGANLAGANLQKTNMQGTNLRGANLQGANLRAADLYKADLREVDLREADLKWVSLKETTLVGANLTNAILIGARSLKTSLESEKQVDQAILRKEELTAYQLITDRTRFLLANDVNGIYAKIRPAKQAMLREAFPRLQWDKPLKVQLQAAQGLFTLLRDNRVLFQQWSNAATMKDAADYQEASSTLPTEIALDILNFIPEYREIKATLTEEQFGAIWNFALSVTPGEGLSRDEVARHLLGGDGIPERWAKANQKEAATSFREKLGSLANEGPKNWVERASHTRQAEWQLER